jgi:hypothetical protein
VNITRPHSDDIINYVPGGFEEQATLSLPLTTVTQNIAVGMNPKLSAGVGFVGYNRISRYKPEANSFQKSVYVSREKNSLTVVYPDLTILAEPKSGYSFAYVIYVQNLTRPGYGTCYIGYDPKNTFTVTAAYYALYTGLVFYAGIPLLVGMMIVLTCFARCCPWEADREHLPLEEDTLTVRLTHPPEEKKIEEILQVQRFPGSFWTLLFGELPTTRLTFRNVFRMFTTSGLKQLGGKSAVFSRNYHICLLTMVTVLTIVSVGLLLPIDLLTGVYKVGSVYGDILSVTVASLDPNGYSTLAHVIYVCVLPIIGFLFSVVITKALSLVFGTYVDPAYTIQVVGIEPITLYVEKTNEGIPYIINGGSVLLHQERLKQQFNERFEDEDPVISVHIPIHFGRRMTPYLRRRRLLEQIANRKYDTTDGLQNSVTHDARKKLEVCNQAIWKIYDERFGDHKPLQTHTIAFVTFDSASAAKECLRQLHEDPNIQATPNWGYDDVMWDNLGSSPLVVKHLRKVVLGTHITVVIILLLAIITFAVLLSPTVVQAFQSNPKDVQTARQASYGILWATTNVPFIAMIIVSVINEFVPVINNVLTKLETHMTKQALFISTLVKSMGYMCILTYLLPYSMHIFVSGTNPSFFYMNQSTRMITAVLSQAIFAKV